LLINNTTYRNSRAN